MLYFWIILLILVILVPIAIRTYALRPGAVRRWRRSVQEPLSEYELAFLFHWQARNLALFVIFAVTGVADAILTGLRLLGGSTPMILWFIFVLLGITGLVHHFLARCPRCSMHIGIQGNLLLPERCHRCRVAFRRSSTTVE